MGNKMASLSLKLTGQSSNLLPIPEVQKLSPRVIRILGCNPSPMTLQGTNTYLVGSGKSRILIDTGNGGVSKYITNLKDTLENYETSIKEVVVTHWHSDHVGGIPDVLQQLPNQGGDINVSKLERKGFREAIEGHQQGYNYITDSHIIRSEGCTLVALHTPGHTTDHMALYLEEENAIFSGDCILGQGTTVFEDLSDYMKSLNILLGLSSKVIYPGHGPVIENPTEKISEYIKHRQQREKQIIKVLQEEKGAPVTAMQVVKKIYTDTPWYLHEAAENNVKHHLTKLLKEDKIFSVKVGNVIKWKSSL